MVQLSQLRGQPLDFALHLVQLVEDGEAFLEYRAAGKLQSLLRQIADADAARLLEGAVVQRLQPGQHLHQRGFSRAVRAHQRSLLVVADEPVGLKKQHARPEPLAGIFERKHESLFSQRPPARLLRPYIRKGIPRIAGTCFSPTPCPGLPDVKDTGCASARGRGSGVDGTPRSLFERKLRPLRLPFAEQFIKHDGQILA